MILLLLCEKPSGKDDVGVSAFVGKGRRTIVRDMRHKTLLLPFFIALFLALSKLKPSWFQFCTFETLKLFLRITSLQFLHVLRCLIS